MMNNRDWRTDEEKQADNRDAPYLLAEAWIVGIVMAAGLATALASAINWLVG